MKKGLAQFLFCMIYNFFLLMFMTKLTVQRMKNIRNPFLRTLLDYHCRYRDENVFKLNTDLFTQMIIIEWKIGKFFTGLFSWNIVIFSLFFFLKPIAPTTTSRDNFKRCLWESYGFRTKFVYRLPLTGKTIFFKSIIFKI